MAQRRCSSLEPSRCTRERQHMVAEPKQNLKDAWTYLKGKRRIAPTLQDPRGNLLSLKSTGHIHHPDAWKVRKGADLSLGIVELQRLRVWLFRERLYWIANGCQQRITLSGP